MEHELSFPFQALKDSGIDCHYVTGGGTGTFPYEASSGVFTEVQPVSFLDDLVIKNFRIESQTTLCIIDTTGRSKVTMNLMVKLLSLTHYYH